MDHRVVYFKLAQGDDVIGILQKESNTHITITQPVMIKSMASPAGDRMLTGLLPWTPLIEFMREDYKIDRRTMIAFGNCPSEIIPRYEDVLDHINMEMSTPDEEESSVTSMEEFLDEIGIDRRKNIWGSNNSGGTIH